MTTLESDSLERYPLTLAVIEDLKRQGLNQTEIADVFGVSHQAITYHVRKYGSLTDRQKALKSWPWKVPTRLAAQSVCQRLRDHAHRQYTGGKGMSPFKLKRLDGFYRRLECHVVEFDPDLPPCEEASLGGFAFRQRLESDGDLLIRVNAHTNLSEEGLKVWRMPEGLS